MRLAAVIALAAVAAFASPSAAAEPCSSATSRKVMLTCLLDQSEGILKSDAAAKDVEVAAALWIRLNEVSALAGDAARARRSADRITQGGQRRLAEARVAVLRLRKGERPPAVAILEAMQRQPLPAGQVDWAAADILAALGEPRRIAGWLEALPADRKADGLLALVRAEQRAGRPGRAEALLKQFGDGLDNAGTTMIVHTDTAMAFVAAGRLDAARRMARLMADVDRPRLEARIALRQDAAGRRAEAEKALDALLASAPRSSDARLARAVLAARHGDFAAAQKHFPASLSYDGALLDELLAALARGGEGQRANAMIATMNNSKDKARAFARLSVLSAKAGKTAEAGGYLPRARAILDPLVGLKHGAAAILIDYAEALATTVEAMVALDRADEARAFTNRLEIAVQKDPFGLARPGVMAGLIGTNRAIFAGMVAKGDVLGVRRVVTRDWRAAAALSAFLDAGLVNQAARIAEWEIPEPLPKTDDFLTVAQYIAEQSRLNETQGKMP